MATANKVRLNKDEEIVKRWLEFYTHPEICEEFSISDALILIAKKRVGNNINKIDTRSLEERACANKYAVAILEIIAGRSYTKTKHLQRELYAKGYFNKHLKGYLRRLKIESIISRDGSFWNLTEKAHKCLQHYYEKLIDEILEETTES